MLARPSAKGLHKPRRQGAGRVRKGTVGQYGAPSRGAWQRVGEFVWILAVAAVGMAVIFSRRPDAFLNPQLWAEDGGVWFQDAYNVGPWRPLLWPHTGYFQTFPRLVSDIGLTLPLSQLPMLDCYVAAAVQLLPALMIASRRFGQLIPRRWVRLWLAGVYLAIPNSYELNVNLTNAQWHLALAAVLLVVAPALSRVGKAADFFVLALSGLTGPFAIALAIPAWLSWLWQRSGWRLLLATAISGFGGIQVYALFSGQQHRPLAASIFNTSVPQTLRVLAGQVGAGLLVGEKGYAWLQPHAWWPDAAFATSGVAAVAVVYCLIRGTAGLRVFTLFAIFVLGGALLAPASLGGPGRLAIPGYGSRYWLIPMLALAACLTWMLGRERVWFARVLAAAAVATMLGVGMRLDWVYEPLPNLHFGHYALQFAKAAPGSVVRIPINPPSWTMVLIKH